MSKQSPSNKKMDMYQFFEFTQKLNYITYFFLGSLLFWLVNLPFILSLLIFDLRMATIPVFFITGLPLGPAFQSLLIAMKKAETEKMAVIFFHSLKKMWKRSFLIWAPVLFIFCLIGANWMLINLTAQFSGMKMLFMFLLVILGSFVINLYLLTMTYESISLKKAILTTLQLSILKSGRYAIGFIIVLSTFVIVSLIPIYSFFFGVGMMAWLLVINYQKIEEFIEQSAIK